MARALVIEDNPSHLQLITYLLEAYGHEPLEAVDGEEGLAAAARDAPDLILCDVRLPKLDGMDLCRRLKGAPELRAIPVVAVTALGMTGDRMAILAAGFDAYIPKPIDPETFVDQIEALLGPRGRHRPPRPVGAAAAEVAAAPRTPAPDEARARLLLVLDDSRTNRLLMQSIFVPNGYRLVQAGTLREALALLEGETPDAILCDVHLPDGCGFDLIRAAKADARWRDVPFLFLTSTAWPEQNRRTGLSLGAERYLVRPLEPPELLVEVEACLRRQ
ncbi:MAG: response regulator [Armatimonadetes bacterium]|nr:response regulator [Armatimonadota bacterium]